VIAGATVLSNANGTAPGQWITGKSDGREKIIVLLPGPPHELKGLFESSVLEKLRAKVPKHFLATRVLKITGMGESACDARIATTAIPWSRLSVITYRCGMRLCRWRNHAQEGWSPSG